MQSQTVSPKKFIGTNSILNFVSYVSFCILQIRFKIFANLNFHKFQILLYIFEEMCTSILISLISDPDFLIF